MPMHPLWQIKQVVTVNGHWYIDHYNVFGGHASQRIWHAFMSLMLWIAVFKWFISNAYLYVETLLALNWHPCCDLISPMPSFSHLP